MTSQNAFRPGARIGALALAFGVVAGGFALGAAPAFAATAPGEEAPAVVASVATDKTNYAATDVVLYSGAGWAPGVAVTVVVDGPMGTTFDGEVAEDGTISGEIEVVEVDEAGNETGGVGTWEEGSYTLTVTQDQPEPAPSPSEEPSTEPTEPGNPDGETNPPVDDPAPSTPATTPGEIVEESASVGGEGNALVTASATFTVGEAITPVAPVDPAPGEADKPGELAQTGADDVFGPAGFGLLAVAAGAAVLGGRRLIAKKA